jgi:hypothetical protein
VLIARTGLALLVSTLSVAHAARLLPQPAFALDQRALKLPILRSGEPCPVSTGSRELVPNQPHIFGSGSFWFGHGPVFISLAYKDSEDDKATFKIQSLNRVGYRYVGLNRVGYGYVGKTPWVSEPSYSGPILIRGHALDSEEKPLEFDASGGRPSPGLHLVAPNAPSAGLWSFWPTDMWLRGPGCYGMQLDTLSGTDVVIFEAF